MAGGVATIDRLVDAHGFIFLESAPHQCLIALFDGSLLGMRIEPGSQRILQVIPESLADQAGIQANQVVRRISYDDRFLDHASPDVPAEYVPSGILLLVDGRVHRWSPEELPRTALPVRPAQVISSLAALGLCLFLCGLSTYPLRDGTIMLLGFVSYAVLRFAFA